AFQLERPGRAAELYRRLLALEPSRGELWKTLGAIELYALGQREEARKSFRRALELELDPGERREIEELVQELGELAGPDGPRG
ncbi:MAG: tetratricopeptide repeat protein, partial [Acidobacteria bacterium]|nr:tetratricopeptide repeat protein [Acidobacteriota bacterium]